MKKISIIFIIIIINQLLIANNYKRTYFPSLGFFTYDLRYINILEKNKDFKMVENEYLKLLNQNKDIPELKDFYNYLYSERIELRKNKYKWLFDSPNSLYKEIKNNIEKKKSLEKLLPLSTTIALYGSEGSYNKGNIEISKNIMENTIESAKINNLIKIDEKTYSFKIYGIKLQGLEDINNPLIFCIKKLENTIFEKMNDKFELTTILIAPFEINEKDIKEQKINYQSFDKLLIYGIIDNNKDYKKDSYYIVDVNNLRLRENQDISSKIIKLLKKDEVIKIIEKGKYEIINEVGGDWVNIKTQNNETGWCFGAFISFDPMIDDEMRLKEN